MDILISVLAVVVMLGLIIYFYSQKYKRMEGNWNLLGQGYNLQLDLPKDFWSWSWGGSVSPKASGTLDGLAFSCETILGSNFCYQQCSISFSKEQSHYLSFYHPSALSKITKLVGAQDIELGNANFDKQFMVKSDHEAFAKQVLTKEIQKALTQKHMPYRFWVVENKLFFEAYNHNLKTEQEYEACVRAIEIGRAVVKEIEKS